MKFTLIDFQLSHIFITEYKTVEYNNTTQGEFSFALALHSHILNIALQSLGNVPILFRQDPGVVRVLADDSESDFYESARKTPRKVRFGGEVVKMRTPESDSSNHEPDPESESQPDEETTTIHITVTDAVSIRTKKSLIPVRITSLPSTPKKCLQGNL